MALYTKSIQAKKQKSDGIRICVMCRPDKNADFDIWMPVLAPSHKLLNDSHAKKIKWDEYVERFTKEVLIGQRKFLKLLTGLALKHEVTILCWEDTPKKCHRRLVAEACKKINPKLKIVLR